MRRFLLIAALLLTAAQVWSANVDAAAARASAQQFLNRQNAGRMAAPAQGSLRLAYTEMNTVSPSTPVFYVFNY